MQPMASNPPRPARPAGVGWIAALVAASLATGCFSLRSDIPPETEAPPVQGEYVIGAGDRVLVRVWKNQELSVDVPVRPDGSISVPLLDDVPAAGMTARELKDVITRELEEYIAHPDVTVIVQEMNSKRAYVLGEVLRSGPVPLTTPMRITDAVSMAGGFGPFADKKDVKLIRRTPEGEQEFGFNYDAYVAGRAPGTNLLLQPGDTVVVPD